MEKTNQSWSITRVPLVMWHTLSGFVISIIDCASLHAIEQVEPQKCSIVKSYKPNHYISSISVRILCVNNSEYIFCISDKNIDGHYQWPFAHVMKVRQVYTVCQPQTQYHYYNIQSYLSFLIGGIAAVGWSSNAHLHRKQLLILSVNPSPLLHTFSVFSFSFLFLSTKTQKV